MRSALLVLLIAAAPGVACADMIELNYVGNTLSADNRIITRDFSRISATATFDFTGAGTYNATAWSLSVNTNGGPITIASATPNLGTVFNAFVLDETGMPSAWFLFATADVFGQTFNETLYTRNEEFNGVTDLADIDNSSVGTFPCMNIGCSSGVKRFNPGTWSLPEPSSLVMLAGGLIALSVLIHIFRKE